MKSFTKKLMVALAAATLAGSAAALPASAMSGALFNGFANDLDEDVALTDAESAARQNALAHGFTFCDLFESTTSQNAKTHVFFAIVTVRCQDVSL